MADLVFVVDDPLDWHRENLKMNSSHYSALKYFGAQNIAKVQERWACGVYYNPYVTVEGQLLKYGVVSTTTLNDDLFNWTHCYLAGRLHKPVLDLRQPNNSRTARLITRNRESALSAALLQLPRYSTKFELYRTITELSYIGDFRMSVGENPNKVSNIVSTMIAEFDKIYYPLLEPHKPFVMIDKCDRLVQETHPKARFNHLMMLPHPIQRSLARKLYPHILLVDVEEALVELSYFPKLGEMIRKSVSEVTWGSSIRQTLQGIVTAGPIRSVRYGFEKLKKKATGTSEALANLPARISAAKDRKLPSLTVMEMHDMESYHKRQKAEHLKNMKPGQKPKDPLVASMITSSPIESEPKEEDSSSSGLITIKNPAKPSTKHSPYTSSSSKSD